MFLSSYFEAAITSAGVVALHLLVSERAKCIACGCLLLFYKNYIVYYNVYHYNCGVFLEKIKFHLDWLMCE